MPQHVSLGSAFLASLILSTAAPAATIWREGEAPTKAAMSKHGWYNGVKKDVLSGGDWISHFDGKQEGTAEYAIDAPEAGDYAFWVRANPLGSLAYKLDGGEWKPIDLRTDQRGLQNIAIDNKPDIRFIAWTKVGQLTLSKGAHTVFFKTSNANNNNGALDCFVLTTDPFIPQGTMKPGAPTASGPSDWFPLLADQDKFDPRSVIDMSKEVPAPAGQFGFVQAAGKDLKFEKRPGAVKFWGCGANLEGAKYTREQQTQRIRYLRKYGINLVRQHTVWDEVTTAGKIDPKKFDAYDWWFAELKKHGIYTDWSIFYSFTIGPEDGYDPALFAELKSNDRQHPERRNTYGIIASSPKLWEIRNQRMVELLQHVNKYTGLRYVDEPALAAVEMNNEESLFFYNPLSGLATGKETPLHSAELRKRWAAWVMAKYGTDAAVKGAWGKFDESLAAGDLKIVGAWELDGAGPRGAWAGQTKRAGDYIQFLAELQRSDFEGCEKAMRTAGLKCPSITTAWKAGGTAATAANTWTDSVGGIIDRHNYAGGGAGGHGITEGKVNNESHLGEPGGGIFSLAFEQVENKPFSISEWTQCAPNQWRVETAPIMAFYAMGLQGWDASMHFAQTGTRLTDGWGSSSYVTDMPAYIGQFPALAFALYHGHIAEGPVVAARRIKHADLFSGTDALKQEFVRTGYDSTTLAGGGTPPAAFAVGRITAAFDGGTPVATDLAKFWNPANKVVQSATGELTWDYGREVITVHAPKTEAVIGKTAAGPFTLPGVTAAIKTPFVSLIFTPLDDAPLAQSKHILITALARDKQSGARYSADGKTLEAVGTAPLLLEPVEATLKFAGAKPASVTPCDPYGVPKAKPVTIAADGSFAIDGTYQAYYYEVKR